MLECQLMQEKEKVPSAPPQILFVNPGEGPCSPEFIELYGEHFAASEEGGQKRWELLQRVPKGYQLIGIAPDDSITKDPKIKERFLISEEGLKKIKAFLF